MAKIVGPVKFKGKIGTYSAYINKKGDNIVRAPGGPSRKKVRTHPHYSRFRHSAAVNSLASSSGKSIREGFGFITDHCKDGSLCSRLSTSLRRAFQSSISPEDSSFSLNTWNHTLLDGLQWNARTHLDTVFHPDHVSFIDPASGATDIIISSFSPADALHQPHDATHFRVVTAALSFLPGRRKALAHIEQSELTPCNATSFPSINVRLQPPTECASVILSGICIIFYGQVRRKFKHLPESAFAITNTCQLPLS